MKVNLKMARKTVMEKYILLMEMYLKESFSVIKDLTRVVNYKIANPLTYYEISVLINSIYIFK